MRLQTFYKTKTEIFKKKKQKQLAHVKKTFEKKNNGNQWYYIFSEMIFLGMDIGTKIG